MEFNPSESDTLLANFLSRWNYGRVENMSVADYADLSNHDSFCYWLEYGSVPLGSIGAIPLHKFELWKSKQQKDFADTRFSTDGVYVWNTEKGNTRDIAFKKIRKLILEVISQSQKQNWEAIDSIPFHAIGKWKIAFMFSDKQLLPIYSKRALLSIAKGFGKEFPYNTPYSQLQKYILSLKDTSERIDDFAYRVYTQFAEKKKKRNYYIIGSKYGDENGNDTVPKISDFIRTSSVGIGFLWNMNFSDYIGSERATVNQFIQENWKEKRPTLSKIQRTFYLLSQLKEGDIIAVKSHGAYNQLTIIAYAEVVKRGGSIYQHNENELGHHINVDFLDAGFSKSLGMTYAETIHQLTSNKDREKFYQIFGWYSDESSSLQETNIIEVEDSESDDEVLQPNAYNEKSEESFERSISATIKVKLIHNRIQNRFIKYLMDRFPNDINIGEKNRIDAKRETENEIIIYEIKPFESVYTCIREGIGQLVDYSYKQKSKKNKHIVIVGPNQPQPDDLNFIYSVRKLLHIPFSYIAFDEATLSAKEY